MTKPGTTHPLPSTVLLPLAVTLPILPTDKRLQTRAAYGLPAQAVFHLLLDLNSSIHRKPTDGLACALFPQTTHSRSSGVADRQTHRPNGTNRTGTALLKQKPIHACTFSKPHPRNELLELYAAYDGFIHRIERRIRASLAEARMLGLDVISTDHGGNTDCIGPLAHPVAARGRASTTANTPSLRPAMGPTSVHSHAAELLSEVAERRCRWSARPIDHCGLPTALDPTICGARYRQQLEAPWDKRHQLASTRFQDKRLTDNAAIDQCVMAELNDWQGNWGDGADRIACAGRLAERGTHRPKRGQRTSSGQ